MIKTYRENCFLRFCKIYLAVITWSRVTTSARHGVLVDAVQSCLPYDLLCCFMRQTNRRCSCLQHMIFWLLLPNEYCMSGSRMASQIICENQTPAPLNALVFRAHTCTFRCRKVPVCWEFLWLYPDTSSLNSRLNLCALCTFLSDLSPVALMTFY